MARIIGYAYDAAMHCVPCTLKCFANWLEDWSEKDEHGLPLQMTDRENNPVHPVFSTDEPGDNGDYCAECRCDLHA